MSRVIDTCLCYVGLFVLALLLPRPATAAFPTDSTVNVPLCIATGDQKYPIIIQDNWGGSVVVWEDPRSDAGDVYAQRLSKAGVPQWPVNGVALCAATGQQQWLHITSDDAGGTIVVWQDPRSGTMDVYAQRISANGTPQWTANGVAICTAVGDQTFLAIAPDGTGGAIITWADTRSGTNDIYAQRISFDGVVQWTANGVPVCTAAGDQHYGEIVPDGAGGAIVAWEDSRSGPTQIFAQRISSDGTPQWPANGLALTTNSYNKNEPAIVSDGAGGAIVAWTDWGSSGVAPDIYAQRLSVNGTPQWPANGVPICTAAGNQIYKTLVSDGMSGAILTWQDSRSGNNDIYAQRISASGTCQWPANGVALCAAAGDQLTPMIATDGAGGAIVSWEDHRNPTVDIYAQRISAAGAPQWTANGVGICTAPGDQHSPTIASSREGGAVIAWSDQRGASYDIYAQRVGANGEIGPTVDDVSSGTPLSFALDPMSPNPTCASALRVHFTLPNSAAASLELLDVAGRRIAAHDVGSLGAGMHTLDLAEGHRVTPGLYLVRLRQGASTRMTRVAVLK